ncbi:MAG: hypothetical protein ACD_77C00353G0003 [uncultured bacterium]|nr:MAG: hypothetical protein ACD_77C00353G0003 [uncultured bacterium]HBY01972.1 hypothetical protein [Rikenellaceae bacterium]
MAVLEKIRVKMGAFITIIIGIALLSFIVDADTLQSAVSMFSSKYDVGEMKGESISYKDYQKKIDYFTQIHQMATGSTSLDEQTQEMVNQGAWQDIMTEIVLLPAIKDAGLDVGEEELFDLSQGSQISPVLTREQAFLGPDGQFDKNKLAEFIRAIPTDESGKLGTYWNYLEKTMKNDQMFSKYVSLLAKSSVMNPVELIRSIDENNITSDVSFIMQPYGYEIDTTIVVSKQEVREYYNKNKRNFEQKASRDIEYVVFEVVPSQEDINLSRQDIDKTYDEFATTTNLKSFLAKNSEKQLNPYYFKKGELSSISPVLDDFAFGSSPAAILPVFQEGNIFRAARINSVKNIPDSVFVQHILLDGRDNVAAQATADSLIKALEGGANFMEVAMANSLDKNPNTIPGELGWMTQNYMIQGFDTCFTATPGKLIKLESQYGLHIIKIREKTVPVKKVQLAILEKSAVASKETFQKYYSQANDLASKSAGKVENFNKLIKEMNLVSIPAMGIAEGAKTVATYKNAREISKWTYSAKKGDVSQIISIDNKYFFVATVTAIREEGIPSLEAMERSITNILKREKSNEKMLAKVKEAITGLAGLDEMANKLGTTVSKQSGLSFGSMGAQSFDPIFVGSVAGAKENTISGPVKGNIGIYIFNVDARQTGAFFTENDAKAKAAQIFTYQLQLLQGVFEKGGDVQDHRARFF